MAEDFGLAVCFSLKTRQRLRGKLSHARGVGQDMGATPSGTHLFSSILPLCPSRRGIFPVKLGGGVWPASQNPYPT